MAQTYRSRFLSTLRANEARMAALFNGLAVACAGEVTRRADANGNVPRTATFEIQRAVGERVTAVFLGRNRAGQLAPFDVLASGEVFPLSPYMRALWTAIAEATRVPVEQHAAIMAARLPVDVLAVLRRARRSPFEASRRDAETRRVGEQIELGDLFPNVDPRDLFPPVVTPPPILRVGTADPSQLFRPNRLATYDAPHRWVDPAGHVLSDRVWSTAGNTRRRLDAFLDASIAEGRGAAAIARDLETFLAPGRQLKRTRAPYGTDASFDAMRLARTEISRAHAQAAEMSAAMNPFVSQMAVVLSGSHPKTDICDAAVAAGPWPKDEIPAQYRVPMHPHCLCRYKYVMVENPQEILDAMREDIRSARSALVDLVGPVMVEQFTRLLLNSPLDVTMALPKVLA